jgi:cell cycle checkpoint protein
VKFQALTLSSEREDSTGHKQRDVEGNQYKTVVVIEDFPNTFSSSSSALMTFRESVLRYLAMSVPPLTHSLRYTQGNKLDITPIIMIVSEMHTSSSTTGSDSFTVGRLLGPQIIQHSSTTVIEFNPIAPTLITKALNSVVQRETKRTGKRWIPHPELAKQISGTGDIRSAINSLQLASVYDQGRSSQPMHTGSAKRVHKKSQTTSNVHVDPGLASRDVNIDLFHAVGKIVYNKRLEPNSISTDVFNIQPPPHQSHYARPKPTEVDVNQLLDDIGTDIDTFISTLHENYVLSCTGDDFTSVLNGSIDSLSDADLISSNEYNLSNSSRTFNSSNNSSNHTTTRSHEYSFQIASRGILFSLPSPVNRGKNLSKSLQQGRDPFKMIYPTALKLWRQIDETENILDAWTLHLLTNTSSNQPLPDTTQPLSSGACKRMSRREMVIEFLPYVAKIRHLDSLKSSSLSRNAHSSNSAAELEFEDDEEHTMNAPIVHFSSILSLPDVPILDDGNGNGKRRTKNVQFTEEPAADVGGLVLSDDDIEDF